jgi:hypothetical protein
MPSGRNLRNSGIWGLLIKGVEKRGLRNRQMWRTEFSWSMIALVLDQSRCTFHWWQLQYLNQPAQRLGEFTLFLLLSSYTNFTQPRHATWYAEAFSRAFDVPARINQDLSVWIWFESQLRLVSLSCIMTHSVKQYFQGVVRFFRQLHPFGTCLPVHCL